MGERSPDDRERARRRFLQNFHNFTANTRFPTPYTQFAGKPLAQIAELGWGYDGLGYRNDAHADARRPSETLRVFVVGDSTMVEGRTFADTVPGRMESALTQIHGAGARVYNFGAISACLNQMTALITSRLMDLEPDVIFVVGGSTDIFQPWSFDPRAGYPYNHFVSECIYDHLFDTKSDIGTGPDPSYESLQGLIFERLGNLRALTNWQSDIWEWEVVRQFELGLKRLARLAPGIGAPVRFVLQPTVARKTTLVGDETAAASGEFLAYLDRQYARFERVVAELGRGEHAGPHFATMDLSRIFEADPRSLFTDIAHYTSEGRHDMAGILVGEVADVLAA